MASETSILAATQDDNVHVLSSFKAHCSAPRTETKSHFLELIRDTYPLYHVTEVDEKRISLFEFAAAGKASIVLDDESESLHATRYWRSVGEGIEKKVHPGKLKDDYRFVRFQYTWEDKEYLVYNAKWQDMLKSCESPFYILYPRSKGSISDGHCAETDDLVLAAGKWTSQLHDEIFVFDDGHWDKSKDLWRSVNGASWDDVILDPEMKKNLIEDVQGFFDNQGLYQQFAVPWKRGVILHGVPGNGKTVSIKALMSALYGRDEAIPSLYVKSFEAIRQTEQYSIRAIFQKARDMAPCLLIFEDLDSLVNDDIRSYFLNEVDGLESNDGILMIGSTNHLDKLDPAIAKRPSRFDRKYHFKIPSEAERNLYAEYWRKKLANNGSIEFPAELTSIVAKLTEGFSFAYLKELFVMALLSLVRGFKADDFEIVDKDEAASANEDDTTDPNKPADPNAEAEKCTCATVCHTCHKLLPKPSPDSADAKKDDEDKEAKSQLKKNKLVMPTVDVPEHLAENLLLKVITHQIRILHADMDNTKEEAWPTSKKGISGKTARAMRRASRRG
ncbi:proteasome-activating nucleotidase [Pyrenochaeta sp. DS3sAY3a]|nr:proteasome-activating nucleotidase [Pyrenochaeta sp. DS3sAY3a]